MSHRILALTLALGLAVGTSAAVSAKAPPKTVTIKACQKKKPPVAFPHDKHVSQKIDCKSCHHKDKDPKKSATGCSTAGCHAGKAEGKRPGCEEMGSKNPFHGKCISCHKEKGKGPKGCADCHKK